MTPVLPVLLLSCLPFAFQETPVLLTADRGGALAPCRDCPATAALGGAARMGTLVREQRSGGPALLIDAGNAFFGSADAVDGPGAAVRDLYEVLGYDVVNVAYTDFRFGLETTRQLFAGTSFVPVSANLRGVSGELLFDAYAVRTVGDVRVAVVGVTLRPPGLDYLPHLRRQLGGVHVTDPLHALDEVLPRARAGADRVILLAYTDRELLRRLVERFGDAVDAIAVGGLRPGELASNGPPLVAASSARGRHLTRFELGSGEGVEVLDVGPDLARDDDVDALLEGRLASPIGTTAGEMPPTAASASDLEDSPTNAGTAHPEQVVAPAPTQSTLGGTRGDPPDGGAPAVVDPIRAAGSSDVGHAAPPSLGAVWREHATPESEPTWPADPGIIDGIRNAVSADGLSLAVERLELTTVLKGREAPADKMHLELDVQLKLARGATPLSISRLEACLFGVLDRQRALNLRLPRREGDLPTYFKLEPGGAIGGRVVLDLPRAGFRSLSLEFVPPGRTGLHVPVLEPARPFAEPIHTRENRAYQVEVLGFEATAELDGAKPTRGGVFVAVDLRARNHLAGGGLPAGLLDWYRMPERIQLVIDGVSPFELKRTRPSELTRELTLLPTERLGGRAVFDVPETVLASATSVELVCGFEPVELYGGGLLDLPPMRVPLIGERPDIALPSDAHRIEDIDCTTLVGEFERPAKFGGQAPTRDSTWLTAEIWFVAPEERGVVIDPVQRCALVDVEGGVHTPNLRTWGASSPSKTGAPFWIPAGGVRRLTGAFQIPQSSVGGAALLYRGLLRVETVAVEAGGAVAASAADPGRSATGQRVFEHTLEPRGLKAVGLEPDAVNRAIDRGREFLWERLHEEIQERGLGRDRNHIPAVLALIHCGAHERYPEFDLAMRGWLTDLEAEKLGVYELGLVAIILDALDDPAFEELFQRTQTFLVESQGPRGTWGYITDLADRLVAEPDPQVEPEAGRSPGLEAVGGGAQGDRRGPHVRIERTQSWYSNGDGDNSASQFAVLGLASAQRRGLVVDEDTWLGVLGAYAERQRVSPAGDNYGGWGYTESKPYGSMTCAGICSTAIALRRLDPALDPRDDLRIRDGLGWLERHWSIDGNPGAVEWHYYYLYGLERVGRTLGTEFIGKYEWYPEGARFLVNAQEPDGSWTGIGREADPRLATSFALLFLQRATRSLELDGPEPEELATGPGTLETEAPSSVGGDNVYVILDASGSMLAELGGRRKFDLARDAVRELAGQLPPGTPFALRAYGHTRRAIEDGANEDTALVLPFGELDVQGVSATLDGLRPRGKTPLTLSLERARGDLARVPAGQDTLVILLTDGGEDTRRDPVEAARALSELGSTQLVIVGFDIDQPRWSKQLDAMAEAARGRYVQVGEASDLGANVAGAAVAQVVEFTVEDASNATVAKGRTGDALPFEPGTYTICFDFAGEAVRRQFQVHPGRTVRVRLDASQGR